MSSERAGAALLALLVLAGCGDLPQPFRGRPGGLAPALLRPPAVRVAVPPPEAALLDDAGGRVLGQALAAALLEAEVPAAAGPALPLDWRLDVETGRRGGAVVPRYRLTDADGRALGAVDGAPVPLRRWAEGDPAALRASAAAAGPPLARLVAAAEAARKSADPASLVAAPPGVRLVPVRGAPGDGDRALTERVRGFLGNRGLRVLDGAEGASFAVEGRVETAPAPGGLQRIEILWVVTRLDGEELGRVLQMNEVARGSLDRFWGDVAYVAAEEAAGGIRDVIRNAGGLPAGAPPPGAPSPAAPPAVPIRSAR